MTDEKLIELFGLLFGFLAENPSKRVLSVLEIVYKELKDRGYDLGKN